MTNPCFEPANVLPLSQQKNCIEYLIRKYLIRKCQQVFSNHNKSSPVKHQNSALRKHQIYSISLCSLENNKKKTFSMVNK